MRRTFGIVAGIVVLVGSSAALAHHSYGSFFLDRTASVEGDIHQLRFQNPHVVIQVRTADSTIYTATWDAADRVERSGVTRATLKIGDHVIVAGAPPRDPTSRELMPVWEIRRPSDGWVWKDTRGPVRAASD